MVRKSKKDTTMGKVTMAGVWASGTAISIAIREIIAGRKRDERRNSVAVSMVSSESNIIVGTSHTCSGATNSSPIIKIGNTTSG